mmetsp:Transcript_986/g.2563  ORF Transcript_986/g.2563 Transcript_986/m.2563 type:complete len:306 (-) Transcript_986:85-1002(-)
MSMLSRMGAVSRTCVSPLRSCVMSNRRVSCAGWVWYASAIPRTTRFLFVFHSMCSTAGALRWLVVRNSPTSTEKSCATTWYFSPCMGANGFATMESCMASVSSIVSRRTSGQCFSGHSNRPYTTLYSALPARSAPARLTRRSTRSTECQRRHCGSTLRDFSSGRICRGVSVKGQTSVGRSSASPSSSTCASGCAHADASSSDEKGSGRPVASWYNSTNVRTPVMPGTRNDGWSRYRSTCSQSSPGAATRMPETNTRSGRGRPAASASLSSPMRRSSRPSCCRSSNTITMWAIRSSDSGSHLARKP